jgi:hypothetical protein
MLCGSHAEVQNGRNKLLDSSLVECPPEVQAALIRIPAETCLSWDALLKEMETLPLPWLFEKQIMSFIRKYKFFSIRTQVRGSVAHNQLVVLRKHFLAIYRSTYNLVILACVKKITGYPKEAVATSICLQLHYYPRI